VSCVACVECRSEHRCALVNNGERSVAGFVRVCAPHVLSGMGHAGRDVPVPVLMLVPYSLKGVYVRT
jgi:hypothetical protein